MEKRNKKLQKAILICGLILNFGMLGIIKYTNFVVENLNALFHMELRGIEYLLPLGISFYTFQTAGYLLDVYWKRVKAEKMCSGTRCLYRSFRKSCRDRSDGSVGWQTSFTRNILFRESGSYMDVNGSCGAFLRKWFWQTGRQSLWMPFSERRISTADLQFSGCCSTRSSFMRISQVEWML